MNRNPPADPPPAADAARLAAIDASVARPLRLAGMLSAAASLLWPVQAALVAWGIAGWVTGATGGVETLWAALGFLALGAARALLEDRAGARLFAAADDVLATERRRLIEAESLRAEEAGERSAAAVAAMATQKLPALAPYLSRYRPAALRVAVVPPVILALSFAVSWAVALILLVAGPLIPVFMALVGMAAKEASRRQMAEIGDMNTLLMERLAALPDIRLLDARERMAADFATRSEGLRARSMAVLRVAFLSSAVLELFAALGVAMVAVYVGFSLLGEIGFGAWGGPPSLAQGLFLLLLAPEFFQPLRDYAAAWHDRATALSVAGELAEAERQAPPRILGEGGPGRPVRTPPEIRLEDVRARGLHLPDLVVAPGERVAITGPSGGGKSTLLAVLAGLIPVEEGRVLVAGRDLTEDSADDWRARLAWIPQAPHFPDAPLREALDPRGTGGLAQALEAAGARDVVEALPEGLETRLGELGAGVSGGEARRLMIARAIAARPEVVLADEPTADLDAETAARVIAGLRRLAEGGCTVIAATHDPQLAAALGRELRVGCPE